MIITKSELEANAWSVFFKLPEHQFPKLLTHPEEVNTETGEVKYWVLAPVVLPVDLTPKPLDLNHLPELPAEEVELEMTLVSKTGSLFILDADKELKFSFLTSQDEQGS